MSPAGLFARSAAGKSVSRIEEDCFQLTWHYLSKATQQRVLYAEMFFDPQAHTSRGVPFDTVIRGIRRAQERASLELGIDTQLILCFLRDLSAESTEGAQLRGSK